MKHPAPTSTDELEELLSRPRDRVRDALARCPGDVIVLGAGGKMGPSLSRMLQRAADELQDPRKIIAVSRFSGSTNPSLQQNGVAGSDKIHVISCDLTSHDDVAKLPDAPNVIFMAGQKFGTSGNPAATWAMNAAVPALIANRYRSSRIVVFSTGNVYPFTHHTTRGARESDATAPVGEYAMSCVAREQIFSFYSERFKSPTLLLRLNYAIDLRYGVLVDIAQKILRGDTVDLTMGYVNVIWQGDANANAIAALAHCSAPATILNVTGTQTLAIREAANRIAQLMNKQVAFTGTESEDALLSDSSQMQTLFGDPDIDEDQLIEWVAKWVSSGGASLAKPTHFEERSGRF